MAEDVMQPSWFSPIRGALLVSAVLDEPDLGSDYIGHHGAASLPSWMRDLWAVGAAKLRKKAIQNGTDYTD
jgi:hypothetical protein